MRGGIVKRGENSWRVTINLGKDHTGNRQRKTSTVRGTRKDAEKHLTELLALHDKGINIQTSNIKVCDYMDQWIRDYAIPNISARTVEGYEGYIRRYIKSHMGQIRLEKLTAQHIRSMYAAMRDKGLSNRTILHTHRILRRALHHAMRWELVIRNVCDLVDAPKPKRVEMTALNLEQSQQFLEITRTSKYGAVFYLALNTGMRRSELLGLQWRDVDLSLKTIAVRRTLLDLKGKGVVEGEPKTGCSRRSISLSNSVIAMLSGLRAKQKEDRERHDLEWKETDYVFSHANGKPFHPSRVTEAFGQTIKQSTLPHIRLHDLRHTHATLLLKAGINPKIVSERLGHASIHITLDTYSHVLPGMQEEAVQRLEEMLQSVQV